MKNTIIFLLLALLISSYISTNREISALKDGINSSDTIPKVIGIGGIFFKCKDPKAVETWYGTNLGLAINDYGSTFEGKDARHPEIKTYMEWTPFKETSKDFDKVYMIDYRVQNLEGLVRKLKSSGVTITDTIAKYDYGKFLHILDNEGNKVELWEPNNSHSFGLGETTK